MCSRWYADVLQLFNLQYRCKLYLDKLMYGLMLIKSRELDEEWIKPFWVLCIFAFYVLN